MSGAEYKEDFDYDGRLVFNGLYITNPLQADIDFENVVDEELADFTRGSPDQPSSGYELLPFSDIAADSTALHPNLKEAVSNVKTIRRKYETWQPAETKEGEQEQFRDVDSYDIYWDYPNYLFVKGDQTQAKRASEIVNYSWGNFLRSLEIEFDPDFLLWIFYNFHSEEQELGDGFYVRQLNDATIEGEKEDRYGKRSQVDRSVDVTKSTTVLIGILRGKDLRALEGTFEVLSHYVKANIKVGGRVHIKVDAEIEGEPKIKRMSLALAFLRELLSLYSHWQELSGENRIPPPDFLQEIYDECERQGATPNFPYDDVVENYRQKRSQSTGNEWQTGLGEFE